MRAKKTYKKLRKSYLILNRVSREKTILGTPFIEPTPSLDFVINSIFL